MSRGDNLSYAVVIPCYNAAEHISETIESISAQKIMPEAVVVVDDCSIDETEEVVKRIACDNLIYLRTDKNFGGPAGPRNVGMDWLAKNLSDLDYIAFLDADDIWPEDFVDIMHKCIEGAAGVFGSAKKFHGNSDNLDLSHLGNTKRVKIPLWLFRFCNPITSCSTNFLRWSAVSELRFREGTDFIANEDYYFLKDLALRRIDLFFVPNLFIGYRQGDASLSANKIRMAMKRIRLRRIGSPESSLLALRSFVTEPVYLISKIFWSVYISVRGL